MAELIDRRQFLLSNHKVEYKGFQLMQINDYYFLYQQELKVRSEKDLDGITWLLVGEVYCVDDFNKQPMEDIKRHHTAEMEEAMFYWTGKWALLGKDRFYNDATGMIPLYFMNGENQWFISSSLHIIYEVNKKKTKKWDDVQISKITNVGWYPVPGTKLKEVFHMYSDACLTLRRKIKGEGEDESYLAMEYYNVIKKCDKELMGEYLIKAVYNIEKYSGKQIWLAFTSGYDSRLVAAAMLKGNVHFKSFLFEHSDLTKGDRSIPPIIAQNEGGGWEHRVIKKRRKLDKNKLREWDEHCFYNIVEKDREFYASGQYDEIPENVIIIKSIFEICRGFYYIPIPNPKFFWDDIEVIYPDLKKNKELNEEIRKFRKWIEDNPNDIDIRDRFYMGQRINGWMSELQQSLDLLPCSLINIANSAAILSCGYWYSEEEKLDNVMIKSQINQLFPSLLNYEFNPMVKMDYYKYYGNQIIQHPITSFRRAIHKLLRKK